MTDFSFDSVLNSQIININLVKKGTVRTQARNQNVISVNFQIMVVNWFKMPITKW